MKLLFDADSIPLTDRGLSYGDGFFETMLFNQGRCSLLPYHLARLCNTASSLGMEITKNDAKLIVQYLKKHLDGKVGVFVVKLLVTRESGGRGYRSSEDAEALIYLQVTPFVSPLSEVNRLEGVSLRLCDLRLSSQPQLAGLKHLNRLENVLARNEWRDESIFEGLLLDQQGLIVEATQSNVFIKIGGRWLTPQLNQCGVAGVMRQWLIEHGSELGSEFHITTLSLDDLKKATACFICNSVLGLVPVQSIQISQEKALNFETAPSKELLERVTSVLK